MSDYARAEDKRMRAMIEDLEAAAGTSNHKFNAWELEFIESIVEQVDRTGPERPLHVTGKQHEKIFEIWEKI